jgi:uncharacterized protein YbjT (DUF2867 family)
MYVVLGATGNTGKAVVLDLLAAGKKVRAVGRSAERLQPLASRGAEPFVADVTDSAALTKAFTGAEGVYAMIPPDLATPDVRSYDDRVVGSIAGALKSSGVKHAIALSSIGADKADKTGLIFGLRELEQALTRIPNLNVLFLRAGDFMENTLEQVGIIESFGMTAGPLRGDLKLPMIACRDIGEAAANALVKLDFSGKQTRELQGQRDLDMNEMTTIIGKAIGKPDIRYVQLPDAQLRPALLQLGMSASVVDLFLEMSAAINSGHMKALEKRSSGNTTPTPFETFVADVFVPVYKRKTKAA